MLIGGGGAVGLNSVQIARRLGCKRVVIPDVGATLSAAGALMSDLSTEFSRTTFTTSDRFATEAVNAALSALEALCRAFLEGRGTAGMEQSIEFSVEARYPHQVWEIEVPLAKGRFDGPADVERLVADRVIFMDEGRIVEEGPPAQVLGNPKEARTRRFLQLVEREEGTF